MELVWSFRSATDKRLLLADSSIQYNTDDRPLPNKFLSINALPATGFRASFQNNEGPRAHNRGTSIGSSPLSVAPVDGVQGPATANPAGLQGGAFGAFGVGLGAWRSKRA